MQNAQAKPPPSLVSTECPKSATLLQTIFHYIWNLFDLAALARQWRSPMALDPTRPSVTPARPDYHSDPLLKDRPDPYVRPRGTRNTYWIIGALIVAVLVIGFFFMRQPPATVPPAASTTSETSPATEPVPTIPTEPATTAPTVPVTPTQPEPTAPTQP